MIKKIKSQSGFSAVEAILILVIAGMLGFTGWYVWHAKHAADKTLSADNSTTPTFNKKSTATKSSAPADPYAGWKTCTDKSEGLNFKYPSNWSSTDSTANNPCIATNAVAGENFVLVSPKVSGNPYVFKLQLSDNQQAAPGYFDANKGQKILSVTSLNVPSSKKPLSMVEFADDNAPNKSTNIYLIALTDQSYKAGQVVDYVQSVTSQAAGGKTYAMTAELTMPGQHYNGDYSVSQYHSQPDYKNIIKIFQSLSY